jgi:hypothetical protein
MGRGERMRQRIALEAARIMLEEGVAGFQAAKQKAASRLGTPDTQNMPRNAEVERAIADYQRLFRADSQPAQLKRLRQTAVQAMEFLADFTPRLVGPVLSGIADAHASVNLHLFADTPEDVMFRLMHERVPFESDERMLRYPRDERDTFPVYRFLAGEVPVELTVFPPRGRREAPLSPVDGRPMERAPVAAVRRLLDEGG